MTAAALDALRVLLAEVGRTQVHLAQRPGADALTVARESSHAQHALQLVAEFLNTDTEAVQ